MALLKIGAAGYEVLLVHRGGREKIGSLRWTKIAWGRAFNDTSKATITLDAQNVIQCCGVLAEAEPWSTEIHIYREGDGLVWLGPLLTRQPSGTSGGVDLVAMDMSMWLSKRRIHGDYRHATITDVTGEASPLTVPTELSVMFEELWLDAVSIENGMDYQLVLGATTIKAYKDTFEADHNLARAELDGVVKFGIDWTTVGRATIAGTACSSPLGQTDFTLTDDQFATPPGITEDGTDQVNDVFILGQGGGADNGTAVAYHAFKPIGHYGLLEGTINDGDVTSDNDAYLVAAAELANYQLPIISAGGGQLTALAPVTIPDLVPGKICKLAVRDCRPIVASYRLVGLDATVDSNGEAVSVSIEPLVATASF